MKATLADVNKRVRINAWGNTFGMIVEVFPSSMSTRGNVVLVERDGRPPYSFFDSELELVEEPNPVLFDLAVQAAMEKLHKLLADKADAIAARDDTIRAKDAIIEAKDSTIRDQALLLAFQRQERDAARQALVRAWGR